VQKTQAGLVESLLEYRQQTEKSLAHVAVRWPKSPISWTAWSASSIACQKARRN